MSDQRDHIHVGKLTPGDVALLARVAEEAADKAIGKWSLAMGLDPKDPIGSQESFAIVRDLRKDEARLDAQWVRRRRTWSEGALGYAVKAIVSAVALGGLGAFASGVAGVFGVSIPHK